jgi:hypothetical protein
LEGAVGLFGGYFEFDDFGLGHRCREGEGQRRGDTYQRFHDRFPGVGGTVDELD